jgi:hypothetical protein
MKLQIFCDWMLKNRQKGLSDWALLNEIRKECQWFYPGPFHQSNLRRLKKLFSLDNIKKLFEAIKMGKGIISGSDEK